MASGKYSFMLSPASIRVEGQNKIKINDLQRLES